MEDAVLPGTSRLLPMSGPERTRTATREGWLRRALMPAAALGVLAFLSCAPSGGSPSAPAPTPVVETGGTGKPAAGKAPDEVTLADLPEAVAQLERLREGVERIAAADETEKDVTTELESARLGLAVVRKGLRELPIDDVREVHRVTATSNDWISSKEEAVTSRLRKIERRIARAAALRATFARISALAEESTAPRGIRLRAAASLALLDELDRRLVVRRAEVLVAVDKVAEVRGTAAALAAEAEARLEEAQNSADHLARQPIWKLRLAGWKAFDGAADRLHRDLLRARAFVKENGPQFLLLSLLVFGTTAALLFRLRRGPRGDGTVPPDAASQRIRQVSWVAAIPVTVVLLVLTAPPAPPTFYTLALLLAAPAAAWIVVKVLGPGMARTVWVLAASVAILPLRGALESFPLVGRVVFLLQTAPLAAVLALDFRKKQWNDQILDARFARLLRKVAWLLAAILVAAAVGTTWGWLGTATRLGLGALQTLSGFVMVAATYLVLVELLRALLSSGGAQTLLSVRHHAGEVLAFGTKTLRGLALAASVLIALGSFDLTDLALPFLRHFFRASVTLGSMSISVGSVVSFVLVLAAVLFLSRALSFLLDKELLPRLQLGRGMPYAISVSTRYLLLFGGFVLACGAAGIDLSKIGFLAGALGVGIGFGLQNIVSNFISGLILLFERPIQVGDTVDVSGAVGTVTHIGIRASTVRSADGAEVVVPNADLISKPLTNWTLSDRHRRFDVVVGVAYGSPLEGTAQALLAAASRTPGVMEAPAPEAFFQAFAASSLDWALRVWVGQDEAPRVLSDLKRAVSEELEGAGIEIPFPQQEIRIRSVAPEARDALRGRPDPA
jgi:small-conductance mechanosensitive channel